MFASVILQSLVYQSTNFDDTPRMSLQTSQTFFGAGLDAREAAVVMRAVRGGAAWGRAVRCTIHQPSDAMFEVVA